MPPYQRVYDRSGYRCIYCGHSLREDLRIWHCSTVDHLYPQSERHGGSSVDANLVAACQLCNSLKGDFIPRALADQPGVIIAGPDGRKMVNEEHKKSYIDLVRIEVANRLIVRERQFQEELDRLNRIGTA